MLLDLKIIRKHIQIIDQSTMSHIHISYILTCNPVSGYQHLTPISERSIIILIYNPVSWLTHISDQFYKHLMSPYHKSKVYTS